MSKEDMQQTIGKLHGEASYERDAIHIAVAPVEAGTQLSAGMRCGFGDDGKMYRAAPEIIGIVDPFLTKTVYAGDKFWLFLLPNTITSLKHLWTHPAFTDESPRNFSAKNESERWMMAWAVKHMSEDYYSYDDKRSDEAAYASAIEAGRSKSVGPYEKARDYINGEWWSHWEAITGQRGDRDTYFSCAC